MNPQRLSQWIQHLQEQTKGAVSVTLTNNRRSMVSIRTRDKETRVRIHHSFAGAPIEILDALHQCIVNRDQAAWNRVRRYVQALPATPTASTRRFETTQGTVYDLQQLLRSVQDQFFHPPVEARITWARTRKLRKRSKTRSLRFGSWDAEQRLIRIHPCLDQQSIPEEFLRYVIYHELCHAVAPPIIGKNGRRQIHHAAFNRLERKFPDINLMNEISDQILTQFINKP